MDVAGEVGAARQAQSLQPGVSIVVPVFRSGPTLVDLVERVGAVLAGQTYEVILVDDGSPPATWSVVHELAQANASVLGIRLGRNFGQHNALVAGVRAARFDVVVTLDDDLQNPPEEIPTLLAALSANRLDVVYGTSSTVAQDRWRRAASSLSKWALSEALGASNAANMSAFRAFRTELRQAFEGEVGPSVSLDALLSWGTSGFGCVEVEHRARAEGRSNYTFRRLLRYAIDTATGYSALPLQIATAIGLGTALFGVGVLAWVIGRLVVSGNPVAGFPFLASTITIFAGAQLVTIGIMGEYLARMHFRLMRKPTYVIREHSGGASASTRADDGDEATR